jgi:hypothetical protein
MKKILFILLLAPVLCNGQITSTSINGWNVEVYKPNDDKKAIFIFIPGNGEIGSNRELLYSNGPLKFIREGWAPDFIVAAAQPPAQWPNHTFLNTVLTELVKRYNVDTTRIYLTGLSAGAYSMYQYIGNLQSMRYKPRAVVPMSMFLEASCGSYNAGTDYLCGNDLNWSGVASWGFAGNSDSHFYKMKRFWDLMASAEYVTNWTTFSGGHGGWNTFYNPEYRENGLNIYEWCLRYPLVSLPVKWLYVSYNEGSIQWATAQEINVSHFVVQQSDDGITWKDASPEILPNSTHKYSYTL